jgi:hypothetical protein
MPGIVTGPPGELRPQLRHAAAPRGQHELGVGRTVVLAQRPGQVPGVQVPFGAGRARHRAHRDVGPPVPVVGQVPGLRQPPPVGPRRLGERHDVLASRHVRQRGELGGVLPGQRAGERVGRRVRGHQPREPAGWGVVEVLVIVVGDAAQVPGEIGGPPFGARRRREPGRVGEMSGQLADHRDPVAVGGQDPLSSRAGYQAHLHLGRLVLLLRCTVPPCRPSGNRFAKPPGQLACQSCAPQTSSTPWEKMR